MKFEIGSNPYLRAASTYIRFSVFILERSISLEDEFDDHDLPDTVYAVLFDGVQPLSTARFLHEDMATVRITRVATLPSYRGSSYGTTIITGMEDYAKQLGYKKSVIHSEVDAKGFYEKLGYHAISDVYMEDGQPCQILSKNLV